MEQPTAHSRRHHYTLYVSNAIASVKEYIDKRPLENKSCEDILECVTPVNRRILEKAFKDVYGYRIKEYQVKQRLKFSKQFLEDGMTIKLVAAKCLYRSQSSFCTAFKHEFNMTPTDWLRSVSIDITPMNMAKM